MTSMLPLPPCPISPCLLFVAFLSIPEASLEGLGIGCWLSTIKTPPAIAAGGQTLRLEGNFMALVGQKCHHPRQWSHHLPMTNQPVTPLHESVFNDADFLLTFQVPYNIERLIYLGSNRDDTTARIMNSFKKSKSVVIPEVVLSKVPNSLKKLQIHDLFFL